MEIHSLLINDLELDKDIFFLLTLHQMTHCNVKGLIVEPNPLRVDTKLSCFCCCFSMWFSSSISH